jgi:plastocyanin
VSGSRVRRAGIGALIVMAALGVATASSGAGLEKRATKKVSVGDDFYAPEFVKIHKGDRVKWVWDALSVHPHNVTLKKGPGKNFHSPDKFAPYDYGHRFRKRGEYKIYCTIHSQSMNMTVRVKR